MASSGNNSSITREKIVKGIKLFILLTAVGILFILYRSTFSASFEHLRSFNLTILAVIAGLVLLDWLFSGIRVYLFAVKVHPGISLAGCMRANLANIFLGGVTPSQTGGGAGQIYILYKEGMGATDATISSFLSFVSTAIFLPLCGIVITTFIKPDFGNATLHYLSSYTLVLFSLILGAVALSLIRPSLFERIVRSLIGILPWLKHRFGESKAFDTFVETFRRYHDLMTYFLKGGLHYLIGGLLLTGIIFFNKFVIAYLVIRGLGIPADFWPVIYLQLLLVLIFYFAPTPGSSGVAEVSTSFIMGQIIPTGKTGVFVILWRFFTLFIGMIAGGYVLTRYLLKNEEETDSREDEAETGAGAGERAPLELSGDAPHTDCDDPPQ